jgi:isoleucyl-tRNA synthetase
MKFEKNSRRRAKEYEADLVQQWKNNKTFEKSVTQRSLDNSYVFYDGPPFITGVPHTGTLLSSITKDVVPRFWTMQGKRVERRWGWDCHGLPAEVYTEKKFGIKDRRDIGTKISLEDYINTCHANMVQTGDLWESTIDRIGRWVDFEGGYRTMDKSYMESVWWAFKELYGKKKIYEGEKVLLYCVRDATPISKSEVAMDNSYQDVTDPSVYVKFKLVGEEKYLLAWTTTPWTLPANTAIAVNKSEQYVEVQVGEEILIMAEALATNVLQDEKHNVVENTLLRSFNGEELVGKSYEPLFVDRGKNAHKVWHADYVTLDSGSGIVHLAPAYGEEDYDLSQQHGFPFVIDIDDRGIYTEGEWQGQQVWEINKTIAKELHERGIVYRIEYITHSYPHCHRCGTKLMYRAHPSWFMDIAGQRKDMVDQNNNINWFPGHLKHGRFEKTVESAPDWNLSRDRFWATAMPVWKGTDENGQTLVKVIGSYAELKELSGVELEDYHRPWVDDVNFTIEGVEYKRIDKVLDCWFESGSMPFAQFHYPFENVEKFESNFPGDFIVEYVGQVRAWFYYVHAISIGLFGINAFKNVITTGVVAGNDGRKMSKSLGNFTDPNLLMDEYSADSLRFLLMSSPLMSGEDFSLKDKEVADVARKLSMVWNMYDFFTLYADVDGWEWEGTLSDPSSTLTNSLDLWIVSRVHQLNQEVNEAMQRYDLPSALKPVLPLLDDASNWYVRRSRKRFWKSDSDSDKNDAYRTLHYVLVQLSLILAPFTPFLADELYQKLTGGESVHLLDWPKVGAVNNTVVTNMAFARDVINEGLSQRAKAKMKARQPLQSVSIYDQRGLLDAELQSVIAEELNVKQVQIRKNQPYDADASFLEAWVERVDEWPVTVVDFRMTQELKHEGYAREIIRNIQSARKQAGLEVDDRIDLQLGSDNADVASVFTTPELIDIILQETLANSLNDGELNESYATVVRIESSELGIKLKKAL